jgi:hypothetical protein
MSLWVDVHRPKSLDDVVGHQHAIHLLKQWNMVKPILLSGRPGIGKTTLAYLVAGWFKMDVFELNASDVRSKADLSQLDLGCRALTSKAAANARLMVLLDEADGVSDVSSLVELIKSAKHPLVLTCNDHFKLKIVVPHCHDIRLSPLSKFDMAKRLMQIASKQGVPLDYSRATELVADGDLRHAINTLQFHFFDNTSLEATPSIFEAAATFMGRASTMEERHEAYSSDPMMVSLFLQENYVAGCSSLERASEVADAVSDADLMPEWSETDKMHVRAATMLDTPCGFLSFPQWLGKNSKHKKNKALLNGLMRAPASHTRMDYMPTLQTSLYTPLSKGDVKGALALMEPYGLTRDDVIDTMPVFKLGAPLPVVETKTKTSFTKKYNQTKRPEESVKKTKPRKS